MTDAHGKATRSGNTGQVSGPNHYRWKGGVTVNYTNRGVKGGKRTPYLRISAGPLRNQYVHILIAEAMLGRPLDPATEEVDHIDGDGLNPHWRNLEVVTPAENKRREAARIRAKKAAKEKARRYKRKMKGRVEAGQIETPNHLTRFDPAEFS